MDNCQLIRILITLTISTNGLFFKIKKAKGNRVFESVYVGRRVEGYATNRLGLDKSRIWTTTRCSKYLESQERQGHVADADHVLVKHEAKSKLPQVDAYARYYSRFFNLLYGYLLVKNIGLCVLAHEKFANWRYLDCFMVGRVIMNGRVIEMAPYFCCFESSIWLIWRYTIDRLITEIKMPCVEFLLDKRGSEPYWLRKETSLVARHNQAANERVSECHSSLLEYRNPFVAYVSRSTAPPHYRVRPNRTREAWHSLAEITTWYYGGALAFGLALMPLYLRMSLPVVMTQRGFEYNYRLCIEWIATSRAGINATRRCPLPQSWKCTIADELFHTFRLPEVGTYTKQEIISDLFMAWTDFVSPSYFQLMRATLDALESILFYFTLGLSFNSVSFICVLASRDILFYCKSINRQLKRLLDYSTRHRSLHARRKIVTSLKTETADIQAQIADLFALLASYNKYISIQCMCLLLFWLGFSAMVSSWMFIPDNVGSKVDWYAMHALATTYYFIILSNMSLVRSSCHEQYELMSSAMALDNKRDEATFRSKKIWLSLLSFYKPRPLYCFTMIDSYELTIISGVQMLAWLFGALVIASSFFQVHNIK